jgi:hypothetical protein
MRASAGLIIASAAAWLLAGAACAQSEAAGRTKAATCVACHGPNGNSPTGQFPILAGQTARYLYLQLRDFKKGGAAAAMQPFVENLRGGHARPCRALREPATLTPVSRRIPEGRTRPQEGRGAFARCATSAVSRARTRSAGRRSAPRLSRRQPQDSAGRRTNDAGMMSSVSVTL